MAASRRARRTRPIAVTATSDLRRDRSWAPSGTTLLDAPDGECPDGLADVVGRTGTASRRRVRGEEEDVSASGRLRTTVMRIHRPRPARWRRAWSGRRRSRGVLGLAGRVCPCRGRRRTVVDGGEAASGTMSSSSPGRGDGVGGGSGRRPAQAAVAGASSRTKPRRRGGGQVEGAVGRRCRPSRLRWKPATAVAGGGACGVGTIVAVPMSGSRLPSSGVHGSDPDHTL